MQVTAQTRFAKTAKGINEIRDRQEGLGPRARQVLILVNGRRSLAELQELIPGDELIDLLILLESRGYMLREVPGAEPNSAFGPNTLSAATTISPTTLTAGPSTLHGPATLSGPATLNGASAPASLAGVHAASFSSTLPAGSAVAGAQPSTIEAIASDDEAGSVQAVTDESSLSDESSAERQDEDHGDEQARLALLRKRLSRSLLDAVGSHGDLMAERIQRAATTDELLELMPAAVQVVEAVGGDRAASDFAARLERIW